MQYTSPFESIFHDFSVLPVSHVEAINSEAYKKIRGYLHRALPSQGHCYLLSSPRAGYGKTHLLSMLKVEMASTHEMILLHPADGVLIDAETVLTDVLSHLTRLLPAGGGLTPLDLLARRIFALGIEPLILSGELPCQDRDQALYAFTYRPIETFDFHHPDAATAHWVKKNFEVLRWRISEEISAIVHAPAAAVSFWIDALFRYAVTPMDVVKRSYEILDVTAAKASLPNMEILTTILTLLSHTHRVVLVADELEGFSTNEDAALRLVSFLTALRSQAGRLDVILSVNNDVWENAFLPKIPSGLLDRISEYAVSLEPLGRDEAMVLLASRDQRSVGLIDQIDPEQVLYARALLRQAGKSWTESRAVFASNYDATPLAEAFKESDRFAVTSDADLQAVEEVDEVLAWNVAATQATESESMAESELCKPVEAETVFLQTAALDSAGASFKNAVVDSAANDLAAAASTVFSKNPIAVAEDFQSLAPKENSSESLPPENDRVADLLRQFRERYRDSAS